MHNSTDRDFWAKMTSLQLPKIGAESLWNQELFNLLPRQQQIGYLIKTADHNSAFAAYNLNYYYLNYRGSYGSGIWSISTKLRLTHIITLQRQYSRNQQ